MNRKPLSLASDLSWRCDCVGQQQSIRRRDRVFEVRRHTREGGASLVDELQQFSASLLAGRIVLLVPLDDIDVDRQPNRISRQHLIGVKHLPVAFWP